MQGIKVRLIWKTVFCCFNRIGRIQKPDTHRHWRNGMQTAKRSVMEKKAVFSYMLRKISRDVLKK